MDGPHQALVQHLVALRKVVRTSRSFVFDHNEPALLTLLSILEFLRIEVRSSILRLLLLAYEVEVVSGNLVQVLFNRVTLPALVKMVEIEAADHLTSLVVPSYLVDEAILHGHQPRVQAGEVVHRRQFRPSLLLFAIVRQLQGKAGWLARCVRRHAHVDLERREASADD